MWYQLDDILLIMPMRMKTGHGAGDTTLSNGSAEVQSFFAEDEEKPTFRTLCNYIIVGRIRVKLT
jgi:hypothetical protein